MTSAPIYIFSDFDGTISTQDTGVVLIDKCMGSVRRKELDKQIFDGVISFREAITQMWDSVNMTWEEGQELLKDVVLDPYFEQFFMYCSAQDIPLFVLSSGLDVLVHQFLKKYLQEKLDLTRVIANRGTITETSWVIEYLDDSPHGHDKSLSIQKILSQFPESPSSPPQQPITIFIGDGVSDICCISINPTLLFAKRGKDLEKYCVKHGIRYFPFDTFEDVAKVVERLVENGLDGIFQN